MIDTVVFDFDGTLADTLPLIVNSFQHVYKFYQGEERDVEYISEFFGEPLLVTLEREFTQPTEEVWTEYKNYQLENFIKQVKLFDNAAKTLDYLKDNNIKVAIVTSRMKQSVEKCLKDLGVNQYFDIIVAVDDTKNHKPHKEPLLKAIDMLNSKPENTLYVGDSRFDVECAINAGTYSALAGWNSGADKLKDAYKIDYVLNNLYDIVEIVKQTSSK